MALLTSCDCGCDVEPIECRNPEVAAYKLYYNDNTHTKLVTYTYETPEATIIQYRISDETRNVVVVPKVKNGADSMTETEGNILSEEKYFDF